MKKTWYTIRAAAGDSSTADISIHDEIGYFGITAKDFIRDLKALGPVTQINLSIHSPGGEVLDGLAIYNVLQRHPANITATIEGIAASMASVIAMAADELIMPQNAFLMIHNPWGIAIGDAADMQDTAALLNKMRDTAVNAYHEKTGLERDELIALMDAETWFTGAEAHARGFVDKVTGTVAMAAVAFDMRRFLRMPSLPLTPVATSEDEPVEPPAPAPAPEVAPAPADPAPVEPTAPVVEDPAPQGFIQRAIASLKSLLPPAPAPVVLTAAESERDALHARVTAMESELAILRPKALERDQLEAALAAAESSARTAAVQAAEIAATAGFRETSANQLPAVRDGEAGTILDQFNALPPGEESTAFYNKHRDQIRREQASLAK